MANDQFHLPGQLGEQHLQEALRISDAVQRTPEKREGMYDRLKATEERIHGYRRTALDIEENRKHGILESIISINRPKLTLKVLIESESYIGGKPFGPRNRMWLSHKGSSVIANGNDLGDWYHVRDTYDQFGRPAGETTLHFETHSNHINKLYNGRPVAMSVAELEIFIQAVELYEQNVRESLYPFDQEIFDLVSEIDEENFIVPDSAEERFGKEIVARAVEGYKAQRGIQGVVIPDTVEEMFGADAVRQIQNDVQIKL